MPTLNRRFSRLRSTSSNESLPGIGYIFVLYPDLVLYQLFGMKKSFSSDREKEVKFIFNAQNSYIL